MLVLTTPNVEGKKIIKYLGIVSGEVILGANIFKDLCASMRNIVGGRAIAYEKEFRKTRDTAIEEMKEEAKSLGGNAVLSVDLDYETVMEGMLMVSASGTAVIYEE
jgi:uncharacterized protein YbjQ (UPF0145 family)